MEFRQFGKTRKIAHCRCINAFSFECLYDNCDEGIGTQRGKCEEVRGGAATGRSAGGGAKKREGRAPSMAPHN